MLGLIGWVLLGIVATGVIVTFWDEIRLWLNNSAADIVEKYLGYNARKLMHRATSQIGRVVNVIRNETVVFSKKNRLDTMYDKVTMTAEADVYSIPEEVINEISKKGKLVQEFEFKGE